MKKNYATVAVTLLFLAGCSNDVKESDIIFAEDSGAQLVFSGVVTDQNQNSLTTRVKDNMWETGDAIGITCGANQVNVHYKYDGGENSLFIAEGGDAAAIWVLGSKEYDVTAYYPFTGTSGSEPAPLNVKTTSECQINTTEQKKIDFLFAHAKVTRENPRVQLNFSHVMSRIKFKFEADEELTDGLSDIICYLIGLKLEGSFNPNTGVATVNTDGLTDDIVWNVINGDNNYTAEAIVLPQTLTNGISVQAGMRGYIYAVDFPALTELKPGYSYNYTIKAKPYINNSFRFEVTSESQILGWNDVNNDPVTSDPDLAGTDAETGNKDWVPEEEIITPTEKK